MVRNDLAIRRHWQLVCCAFAFCWWQEARQAHQHVPVNSPVRKKLAGALADAMSLATAAGVGAGVVDATCVFKALATINDGPVQLVQRALR